MVPDNNQQYGPTDKANLSMDNPQKKHSYRMILITVVVLLIAIGGYLISRNENLQEVLKNTVPSSTTSEGSNSTSFVAPDVSVIANRELPWVEIARTSDEPLTQNQSFTVVVKASSGGKDITGYDVLLAIDPNYFQVESITSDIQSFSILQFEKGSHVTVTGLKELGQNAPTIFDETQILTIQLKPTQTGQSNISVLLEKENEKTMLVDTDVNPITPQVGSLSVSIE